MIGADEVRSVVRESIGVNYAGYRLDETWSIADIYAQKLEPGNFYIWRLQHARVVIAISLDTDGRFRLVSNTGNVLETLTADIGVIDVRHEGQFQIDVRQVGQYNAGRVYLAGDAAHCHSPVGGRGMNLGIADAADLATRLVSEQLSGYSDARHAIGARIIRDSEQGRRAMTTNNWLTSWFVDNAFRSVAKSSILQDRFARQMLDVEL